MQTTTTFELHEAFKVAIGGITPTIEAMRVHGWKYVDSHRKNGRALLPASLRSYDLIWRDVGASYLWKGGRGVSYSTRLAVCTSYPGMSPALRDHVIGQDGVDLRRALRRLINNQTGLVDVTETGRQNEVEAEASYYIEHTFLVSYHQRTV